VTRLDLHTHSIHSDGTLSPAEVVRRAHARGVEVMALTDHDSVFGFAEAEAEGNRLGVKIVRGIEINTAESDLLHILGYGIDPGSEKLKARLEEFRARRLRRAQAIVEKLRRTVGLDIAWEDVAKVSRGSLGRPHVADALMRKGLVGSRKEAFDRYLSRGRPGYVDPMGPSAEEAIATIREAGGWPSLAHPGTLDYEGELPRLAALGLEGIETYYPTHSNETVVRLLKLALDHRLLPTAGSDFHGPGTGRDKIGGVDVGEEVFEKLMGRLAS